MFFLPVRAGQWKKGSTSKDITEIVTTSQQRPRSLLNRNARETLSAPTQAGGPSKVQADNGPATSSLLCIPDWGTPASSAFPLPCSAPAQMHKGSSCACGLSSCGGDWSQLQPRLGLLSLLDLQDGWVGLHNGHDDPVDVVLQTEVDLFLLLDCFHELKAEYAMSTGPLAVQPTGPRAGEELPRHGRRS